MRVIVYQASDTSALSKNFTRKDFKCPCGCSRQMVDSELVEKLQAIRDKLGKAIKVALLAEGVDRNSLPQLTAYSALHPGIANLSPIGLIVRGTKQK